MGLGLVSVPFQDLLTCRSAADVSNLLSPVLASLSTGSSFGTQFRIDEQSKRCACSWQLSFDFLVQ